MESKKNLEELKLQSEIIKNKTAKLRLVASIAAVISIIIPIISLLVFKQDVSGNTNGSNQNINTTQTQNNNIQSSDIKNNNTNSVVEDNEDDDLE